MEETKVAGEKGKRQEGKERKNTQIKQRCTEQKSIQSTP